jgi:hypothetical protein
MIHNRLAFVDLQRGACYHGKCISLERASLFLAMGFSSQANPS